MKFEGSIVRYTPTGFAVLWISISLLLGGAILLSFPLLLAGLSILCVWLISRSLASRHLESVEIFRPLPKRAWTGRSFAVEAALRNSETKRPAMDLNFSDPIAVSNPPFSGSLPPRAEAQIRYTAKCPRRGLLRADRWSIASDWPLGWFETRRPGRFLTKQEYQSSVLVLPSPFLPHQLRNHLEGLMVNAALWSGLPDPTSEFRLLREFRSGDPVRKIHWPPSLKSGELLVRESDPPRPAPKRFGILIHSFGLSGEIVTPETFEMILRIAAGLLYRFREAGIEIVFQHLPGPSRNLVYREDFDKELDQLALVSRSPFFKEDQFSTADTRFEACDERFVLGDSDRSIWESFITAKFGPCHCIDANSLSLASRPLAPRPQALPKTRPKSGPQRKQAS